MKRRDFLKDTAIAGAVLGGSTISAVTCQTQKSESKNAPLTERQNKLTPPGKGKIRIKRGLRFIEGPKISTASGLTSGIDLALRVVERYFGREVAQGTAAYMEYQSTGWMV